VFAVSVAFIVIPVVAFGGINVTLCTVDISMYVSLIGFTLAVSNSTIMNTSPKTAFETLLLGVVVLLTASCSPPPTEVVVVVIVLPLVEADIVLVDAKIIVSVKIVATRWMLRSRGIFLLRLFGIPILSIF
jgi:hypothetical protein